MFIESHAGAQARVDDRRRLYRCWDRRCIFPEQSSSLSFGRNAILEDNEGGPEASVLHM